MATENLNIVPTKSYTKHEVDNPKAISPLHSSVPLGGNPGVVRNTIDFGKAIFGDFYNLFRLTGYFFESNYSAALRNVPRWFGIKDNPLAEAQKWSQPDWKVSKARGLLNTFEAITFMGAAFLAFIRDYHKLRRDVGGLVQAEFGKSRVTVKDLFRSRNPLLQTAMNRYQSLYTLRFFQPLTFLWGLRFGINSTLMEIVAERAAYFEEKSYDKLQKVMREIHNNQWGSWSRESLVARLVDIIQQNRAEHKTAPVQMRDLEGYFPLLRIIADHMLEEKWSFADVAYMLGEIIRDPANPQKAQQAYAILENYGLDGVARQKMAGQWPAAEMPQSGAKAVAPANDEPGASLPTGIPIRTPERPVLGPATEQLVKKAQQSAANLDHSLQQTAS